MAERATLSVAMRAKQLIGLARYAVPWSESISSWPRGRFAAETAQAPNPAPHRVTCPTIVLKIVSLTRTSHAFVGGRGASATSQTGGPSSAQGLHHEPASSKGVGAGFKPASRTLPGRDFM